MIAPLLSTIDAVTATARPAGAVLPSVAAGGLVGLSLGLAGGGGAIFAVPLLVYGIGVDPRTAVSISLVIVAAAGVCAVGVGSWAGRRIGGPTLARIFSVAIVLVAAFIIFKRWRRF